MADNRAPHPTHPRPAEGRGVPPSALAPVRGWSMIALLVLVGLRQMAPA
jgi:hypothetical protein